MTNRDKIYPILDIECLSLEKVDNSEEFLLFVIDNTLCIDMKKLILGYLEYGFKNLLTSAIFINEDDKVLYESGYKLEKFIESNIHHYEPHNFVWETYSRTSKKKMYEYTYVNGKIHGLYKSWNVEGVFMKQCEYEEGKLHGKFYEYYPDGVIKTSAYYYQDNLHGNVSEWDNDGNLVRFEQWLYGKKHGKYIIFNQTDNGILLTESKNYINGKLDGPYYYYLSSGRSEYSNYKQGKLDGEFKSYDINGKIEYSTEYKDGIEDGIRKEYYMGEDRPFIRAQIVMGERHGLTKIYYKTGKRKEIMYQKDEFVYSDSILPSGYTYRNNNYYEDSDCSTDPDASSESSEYESN